MTTRRHAAHVLLTAAAIAVGVLSVGCDSRPANPPVHHVHEDDAAMNAAIEKARASADEFIAAMDSPAPTYADFSVKAAIKDGDQTEHIWLMPVRHEAGVFHGTIGNEPVNVSNVKLGDEVSVSMAEISDWLYLDGDKLVGGYTLRVLRDRMSPPERAAFDQSVPFVIE